MSDLYRLIYASRSLVGGATEDRRRECERILAVSRHNNGRDGVTGALLFAAGAFAQILEGPRAAVEATFERIQCDARHGDIDVLQCEAVACRAFAAFDMAFVGQPSPDRALFEKAGDEVDDGAGGRAAVDIAKVEAEGLCAAVLALVRAQEQRRGRAEGAAAVPRRFDEGRVRAELSAGRIAGGSASDPAPEPASQAATREAAAPAPHTAAGPDPGDAVLRAALDEERGRTTELRRELDAARVALARAVAEAEGAVRHRDIWADRSAQMRTTSRGLRELLADAEAERDGLRRRQSDHDAEVDRLRVHRDVWAGRARALAAALCREPAEPGPPDVEAGDGVQARARLPALREPPLSRSVAQ